MIYHWYDLLGNFGVALILLAYFLLQSERVRGQDISYLLLNTLGAMLVLVSLWFDFNLSAFIIEALWVVISLYGLTRLTFCR